MIDRRLFLGSAGSSLLVSLRIPASPARKRRWPAEWEPHAYSLMAWPYRRALWERRLGAVQQEYAAVARAVAAFEPVHMVATSAQVDRARKMCGDKVSVHALPLDDSWTRDSGATYVVEDNKPLAVDFAFNAWGKQFDQYKNDDALPRAWCRLQGERCETVDWVLEGGAIVGDGEGTLITTEECLLNPNRNGKTTKAEVEAKLEKHLGVTRVIWIPYGLSDDDLTSGHVDGVCAYVGPRQVLVQTTDADAPAAIKKRMQANLAVLRRATDARGRKLELHQIPHLAYPKVGREEGLHTYANLYQANGGVVVPLAGVNDTDAAALAHLRRVFKKRKVVGVPTPVIGWGGGGVHCITQQVPKGV